MKSKDKILQIFIKNSGKVISGESIAKEIGISRNAVWKNIKNLQEDGYNIASVPNKGYKLNLSVSYLSEEVIKENLDTTFIGKYIEVVQDIDSTNTYLKNLDNTNQINGRVMIANRQTKGRGRLGRSFFSPKDSGIYLSIILKPELEFNQINLITVIAGLSMIEAIKKISGLSVNIKWVNDILKDNKKLCGILTEGIVSVENGKVESVIVGVGLNVNKPAKNIPEDISNIVGYISEFTNKVEDRNLLISTFLNIFEKKYLEFDKDKLLDEYKELMLFIGQEIVFLLGSKQYSGRLLNLNNDFSVDVAVEGEIKKFSSGEIKIIY